MADLLKVMERECLHSEHAAQCFLDARRRESAKAKNKPKCLRDERYDENMQGPCSSGQCQWPDCKPAN